MQRDRYALRAFWTSLVLVALVFAGQAMAQDVVLSPRSIVVNPMPAFDLEVWVDKDPSGPRRTVYAIGEAIRISVRPSEDAYVYLFSIAADGEVVQILPNRFDDAGRDAFVRAGTTRTFPPAGRPLHLQRRAARRAGEGDRRRQPSPARRVDARHLPQRARLRHLGHRRRGLRAGAAHHRQPAAPDRVGLGDRAVLRRHPAGRGAYGTLQIDSEPRGGEVYVDRTFVGYTPLTYGVRPGTYDVEVVGAGGRASHARPGPAPTGPPTCSCRCAPWCGSATATFTSNPSGADVYVAGNYVGTTPTGRVTFDVGTYQAEFRRRAT
jgi:hypothetical protein